MTRCVVVGSPIGHSLSPTLHRAAYAALGLDWDYDAVELGAGLAGFLADVGTDLQGLSVTMPLKAEALAVARDADPTARLVGVANTLVRRGEAVGGGYSAHNTDVVGVRDALTGAGVRSLAGADVVVVGAGGTARAVLAALGQLGVGQLGVGQLGVGQLGVGPPIRVLARRPTVAAAALTPLAEALGLRLTVGPVPDSTPGTDERSGTAAEELIGRPDLLVATTPAGAVDGFAAAAARAGIVFDVLYHPWPTPLVAHARRRGAVVVGGLDLLVAQAARQVELMTGRQPAPVAAMRAAGEAVLAARAGR